MYAFFANDLHHVEVDLRGGHVYCFCEACVYSRWLLCLLSGEDKASHRDLVDFVKDFRFERMGCFIYSEEDGTPAASFDEQVSYLYSFILLKWDLNCKLQSIFLQLHLYAALSPQQQSALFCPSVKYPGRLRPQKPSRMCPAFP